MRKKVLSGEELGKVLGYGLLYSGLQENQEFVRETVSSALLMVAEKQGVRTAFTTPFSSVITVEFGAYIESDPLSINKRPAEGLVNEAEEVTRIPTRSLQVL